VPLEARAAAAQVPASASADTAQRDVMDILGSILGHHPAPKPAPTDSTAPRHNVAVTALPSFAVNPTVGVLVGVSGNAVTRFGPSAETNASVLTATLGVTTKKQLHFLTRTNLVSRMNRVMLHGDWRYLDTKQPTWGLGRAQPASARMEMDFILLRFYETVYLAVAPRVFLGVGYHLDDHYNIVDIHAALGPTPFLAYNGGRTQTRTTSSGFSLDALHDTRDNPINPGRGVLIDASLQILPTWLGSDDTWQSLQGEVRVYPTLAKRHRQILALWGFAWLSFGHAPYLDLPSIGWDPRNRTGRGYIHGRIRGTDLLYAEAEYRVTLSANSLWGAVAFMNLTSASALGGRSFPAPEVAGGLGLRIKLNKHSNTNITLDFAVGAQGSRGIFLGTGEAF
jgi:hypothetical protein